MRNSDIYIGVGSGGLVLKVRFHDLTYNTVKIYGVKVLAGHVHAVCTHLPDEEQLDACRWLIFGVAPYSLSVKLWNAYGDKVPSLLLPRRLEERTLEGQYMELIDYMSKLGVEWKCL